MVQKRAIVIGSGIAGLAMARSLVKNGYAVSVFERMGRPVGASVRNFGMIWPVGQKDDYYTIACRSRDIWKELAGNKVLALRQSGSMHVAHEKDEWQVLSEVYEHYRQARPYKLLKPQEVINKCAAARENGLIGGLYSYDECVVDPYDAIMSVADYLREQLGVRFFWNTNINHITSGKITTAAGETHEADLILACSGADLESLFPQAFDTEIFTRCKLQMLRFVSQGEWSIGASLCGGLSLTHYKSFAVSDSLEMLRARFELQMPEHVHYGIHVMVSQNSRGELTVGDSHEYGNIFDPFDKSHINELILSYLDSFARFKNPLIMETWNGIYSKMKNGQLYYFQQVQPGVYLFNGLGGNGMTLSFGLGEKLVAEI